MTTCLKTINGFSVNGRVYKEGLDMKLNPDCIRDTLLKIEVDQVYEDEFGLQLKTLSGIQLLRTDLSQKYTQGEILYTVKQLHDSGLVSACPYNAGPTLDFVIRDITPIGHEFLNNVRSDTVWANTKGIAKKIGVGTLKGLVEISSKIIGEVIAAYLKKNSAI